MRTKSNLIVSIMPIIFGCTSSEKQAVVQYSYIYCSGVGGINFSSQTSNIDDHYDKSSSYRHCVVRQESSGQMAIVLTNPVSMRVETLILYPKGASLSYNWNVVEDFNTTPNTEKIPMDEGAIFVDTVHQVISVSARLQVVHFLKNRELRLKVSLLFLVAYILAESESGCGWDRVIPSAS